MFTDSTIYCDRVWHALHISNALDWFDFFFHRNFSFFQQFFNFVTILNRDVIQKEKYNYKNCTELIIVTNGDLRYEEQKKKIVNRNDDLQENNVSTVKNSEIVASFPFMP